MAGASLSTGERQRIELTSTVRSSTMGMLYVLDEPSVGLHPSNVHDLDLLAAADHLIDMGPGSGPDGGHILAAGKPADVARAPGSATGPWLPEHLSAPAARRGFA